MNSRTDHPLGEDPGPPGLRTRAARQLARTQRYPAWVLAVALTGMFATTFPITILTVSLGQIAREFRVPEALLAWVISAPMLLSAVALPLLGKLGDLYGHRRVFLVGFAASTAAALATALAWGPLSLIGFRTLSQVIGSATQPTSMALILGVTAREDRVRAMGWWAMTAAGAPAVGLLAGGPLVDALGWRLIFVAQALFSLGALAIAALVLRETPRLRVRFDILGALALAVGVAGLMFALSRLGTLSWRSPWMVLATAAGGLALAGFVAAERRSPAPLLPLEFFRRRNFTAPSIANGLLGAAYMGAFVLAPWMLLDVFRFSIAAAALMMLLRTLSFTLASPLGGLLGARIGERKTAVLGTGAVALALGGMALASEAGSIPAIAAALVLQGLGNGLALPPLTSSISNAVAERDLGIASAAQRLANQGGAAFGITLLTLVTGEANTPFGFARGFGVGALLAAAALAASAATRPERRRRAYGPDVATASET